MDYEKKYKELIRDLEDALVFYHQNQKEHNYDKEKIAKVLEKHIDLEKAKERRFADKDTQDIVSKLKELEEKYLYINMSEENLGDDLSDFLSKFMNQLETIRWDLENREKWIDIRRLLTTNKEPKKNDYLYLLFNDKETIKKLVGVQNSSSRIDLYPFYINCQEVYNHIDNLELLEKTEEVLDFIIELVLDFRFEIPDEFVFELRSGEKFLAVKNKKNIYDIYQDKEFQSNYREIIVKNLVRKGNWNIIYNKEEFEEIYETGIFDRILNFSDEYIQKLKEKRERDNYES